MVKNLPANAGFRRLRFHPWVGKLPWRRKWQPTPVFLLGGYRSWGYKESGMAEHAHTSMCRMLFVHLVTHSASPLCTMDTTESFPESFLGEWSRKSIEK